MAEIDRPPPSTFVEKGAPRAAPQPGSVVRRVLWLVAHSTLLLLLGLVLLAAGPVYGIVSDGAAPRWQDDHAICAFVLRVLNLPLALALVVGVLYVLGRVVGFLLGLDGPRIGSVRAGTTKLIRFLLVVGILELFPWLAKQILPSELARALLGMLLLLVGASSDFRFSPMTRKDVVFTIGLALAIEGVASLLWDSGWVWQGWGGRFAKAAVLASVVMVLRRWRRHKNGGFESSAKAVGKAVEQARSFALRVRATRGKPLGPADRSQGDPRQTPRPAGPPPLG